LCLAFVTSLQGHVGWIFSTATAKEGCRGSRCGPDSTEGLPESAATPLLLTAGLACEGLDCLLGDAEPTLLSHLQEQCLEVGALLGQGQGGGASRGAGGDASKASGLGTFAGKGSLKVTLHALALLYGGALPCPSAGPGQVAE
jgi:hypothetical protein